jgi:hypothetical protein
MDSELHVMIGINKRLKVTIQKVTIHIAGHGANKSPERTPPP